MVWSYMNYAAGISIKMIWFDLTACYWLRLITIIQALNVTYNQEWHISYDVTEDDKDIGSYYFYQFVILVVWQWLRTRSHLWLVLEYKLLQHNWTRTFMTLSTSFRHSYHSQTSLKGNVRSRHLLFPFASLAMMYNSTPLGFSAIRLVSNQ